MLEISRKVLITGGAGFIGSHLIDNMIMDGHQVLCIDDLNDFYDPQIKRSNIGQHLVNPQFKMVHMDIRDLEGITKTFLQWEPDIVVHLAARAGVRPSLNDPFLYNEVNISGTLNLLNASAKTGVKKFIFGSSSSVYGVNEKVPFSESDPLLKPISTYAATKLAGEALSHTFAHLYDLPTVSLRFFTVYGPRQRPDLAIHKFASLIMDGKPIPVYGDGLTRRDYTYIDDIILGIRAAIEYNSTPYDVFNLGNSQTVELRQLISLLEEAIGNKAIINRFPNQPGDVPETWADTRKASSLLGFRPNTPIRNGLELFLDWLRMSRITEQRANYTVRTVLC